jgi:DNA-binding GntR family transcriptional regulator
MPGGSTRTQNAKGGWMTDTAVTGIGAHLRQYMTAESSVEEATTTALRIAIRRGMLQPGLRLRQEDLAEQLGVSRIPLRDAFRRLEAEGLVEIEGRRGARVRSLSADDVAEIYELLIMIEVPLMRLAVRNLDAVAMKQVLELSEQMDVTPQDDEVGRLSRKAFYGELYRHGGRPRIRNLVLQLRDDVHRYHVLKNIGASLHAHAQLRECIRAKDAEGAAAEMRRHLRMSRDDLVAVLRREERARDNGTRRGRQRT